MGYKAKSAGDSKGKQPAKDSKTTIDEEASNPQPSKGKGRQKKAPTESKSVDRHGSAQNDSQLRKQILSESESETTIANKEAITKKQQRKPRKGKATADDTVKRDDINVKQEDESNSEDDIEKIKAMVQGINSQVEQKETNKKGSYACKTKKYSTKSIAMKVIQMIDDDNEDDENEEEQVNSKKPKSSKTSVGSNNSKAKKGKKVQNTDYDDQDNANNMSEEENEFNRSKSSTKNGGQLPSFDFNDQTLSIIDVQKEQGKGILEEQYELPYYLTKPHIRDINNRSMNDPKYDGSTVFIPEEEFNKETPLFKQYWKTKQVNYDKVVFFRFGRNFSCYFNDAILLKRLFDCQITVWGKRPMVAVFDNSFRLFVKELLDKYEKSCVVVDQVQFNDDKLTDQDLIQREITQIITKGTYTDYLDSNEDYNARYLMCMVESGVDHSFGITLVDCTTHQIYVDDIKNDPAGNQIRTILQKMKPVEIHSVFNNMSDSTKNICKSTCKPQFTYDKKFEFSDIQDIFEELKKEYRQKIPFVNSSKSKGNGAIAAATARMNQMEIQSGKKSNNISKDKKQQNSKNGRNFEDKQAIGMSDEEEDDNEDDQGTGEGTEEKQNFTYGALSSDYPSLLRDIEELYLSDKMKFEAVQKKQTDNKQQNMDIEEEEEPCFDVEFQYYMMLQSLMLTVSYLRSLKLSENVFRMGTFNLLDSSVQKNTSLHLDAHAIENLDIFEVNLQSKTTTEGSLMSFIDYTKTPFGKRMLKRWLAYPLKSIEQIQQRQESIEDLMAIDPVVKEFDKKLSKLGDIERQISKVFNSSQKSRLKPSSFENFSSSRLKDALDLSKELKALETILPIFSEHINKFNSMRLKKLCTVKDQGAIKRMLEQRKQQMTQSSYVSNKPTNQLKGIDKLSQPSAGFVIGMFPDLKPFVKMIDDQLEEDEQGFCVPKPGADHAYDEVVVKIKDIYKRMNEEAKFWSKRLKDNDIKLVKTKLQWEIQIPERLVEDMKKPKELYLTSKIKSYQRFQSDNMIHLCTKLKRAEQHLQKALIPFCERLFYQFYQNRDLLYQAVNCISELDCLSSLAKCANGLDVRCKPNFISSHPLKDANHIFDLREMYHPQMLKDKRKQLIPNDTVFENGVLTMLVTGPNMGGKSTLLRQTCLAVILAQVGAFIPARSFTTAIKDRIFCRIGASDRLEEGKSTFLVEMEETGDIVKEATRQSIVLLDELGRGTSTFDGVSIAYGVLRYLVEEIQCLTLFSTHYHMLVDEFKLYPNVESYCMDFQFEDLTKNNAKSFSQQSSSDRRINFKYKFIKGFSEKSFGLNVAKMAAIPDSIIRKARGKEDEIDSDNQNLGNMFKIMQTFNQIIKPFIQLYSKHSDSQSQRK